jgi:hypothetical protein
MAIVIGASTTVSFGGACVISANWGYNPNVTRLYCIGEWIPDATRTYYRPTETLSLTIYSPGPTYPTEPTQDCFDANTIAASIDPRVCGESYVAFDGQWWVTSYSYSKDDGVMPGQESWSLTRWKDLNTAALPGGITDEPTYVMRNIVEGQATGNAGIVFTGATVETYSGNVSANSIGKAYTLEVGVVSQVGGGSSAAGETGQGSASISYTQLYI